MPCCRRCCCVRRVMTPAVTVVTPFQPQNTTVAQFINPGGGSFLPGSPIPLTTSTFNNTGGGAALSGGNVILTGPGTYIIDYSFWAITGGAAVDLQVSLLVNGTVNSPSSIRQTIPANSVETLSNHTVISITNFDAATIQINNTGASTITVSNINMVVTKIG